MCLSTALYSVTLSAAVSDGNKAEKVSAYARKSREIDTQLVSFTSKEVPEHPLPHALEVADKFKETGLLEEVKKLFEIRPIWSKAAMRYHLRDHAGADSRLKFILPVVAYFFLSGPWRALWVKYGYDPRKDPSAKKYQIFDFRMRHRGLGPVERNIPEAKRGLEMRFLKPSLPTMPMAKIHEINMGLFQKEGEGGDKDKQPKLSDFEFHPAVLPPNRQVYYQLCDIYDQEIQALVAKNDGKEGTVCDEKNGWCVKNMSELCRQIIVDHVEKLDPRLPNKGYKYDQHQRKRAKVMQANMDEESDDGDDDYT
nr:hypothetical protein BaRGS_020769 [Batillaria attramentaria]